MTTTQRPPARLEARLRSHSALLQAMNYRRMTVRELALACGRANYRSSIGHLRAGSRTTVSAHLARRIEEGLLLPPGALFDLVICSISSESATPTRGRKAA